MVKPYLDPCTQYKKGVKDITLSKLLKKYGAYEKFIHNFDKEMFDAYPGSSSVIARSFTWSHTPEGRDFWERVHNRALKYNLYIDMDLVYTKTNLLKFPY